jgi:hypothetical protein
MKQVELYAKVRYAVQIEGLSERAAARRDEITVFAEIGIDAQEVRVALDGGMVGVLIHRHAPRKLKVPKAQE